MLLTTRAPRRSTVPRSISFRVFVGIALSCRDLRRECSRRPVNASSTPSLPAIGRFAAPIAVRAARLLEQAYLLDFHPAVHRLHHGVDREPRNRPSGPPLHLS